MKRLTFTREAIRRLDRLAAIEYHIPSIVLMENAAAAVARAAVGMVRAVPRPRIVVYCGPGNNGGDGLGAARHLHNGGALVRIVLAGHPREYRGDAKINYEIVRAMGIPRVAPDAVPRRPDLVIDALLGTGLSRAVEEPIAALIERINGRRRGVKVLSIDIPSGMDADSGEALGVAVRADVTVSLVGWKVGFLNKGAKEHLGKVVVVGIGVPRELEERLGEER